MRYMGSKLRHAKHIARWVQPKEGGIFVEPFCGGANLTSAIKGKRICADVDADLISLWQSVSRGEFSIPPTLDEKEYARLRNSAVQPLKGYAAFSCSFGGKKWGGYARDKKGLRDLAGESAAAAAAKQFPLLLGVDFRLCSYEALAVPDGAIVYCDPPYANTTKYSGTHNFDHDAFWRWAKKLSRRCEVYVSEYNAPDDWVSVWEKEVASSLKVSGTAKRETEKLFIHEKVFKDMIKGLA